MRNDRSCAEQMLLSRRQMLGGASASLAMWGLLPKVASASGARDPRLLTVILRGGLDGLSMVAPIADPAYARIRQQLALTGDGPAAGLPLDNFFVLNPSMPNLHALYQKGEALCVHAVASPYRGRSHFDGQDVLESGLGGVGRSDDGWLNRALGGLNGGDARLGLSLGPSVPLILQGAAPVQAWSNEHIPDLDDDFLGRLDIVYRGDPLFSTALREARGTMQPDMAMMAEERDTLAISAAAAAAMLGAADGPRIAVMEVQGWDTHTGQAGRLERLFTRLAHGLMTLREGLGPATGANTGDGRVGIRPHRGREWQSGHRPRHRRLGVAGRGAVRGGRIARQLAGPVSARVVRGPRPAGGERVRAHLQGDPDRPSGAGPGVRRRCGVSRQSGADADGRPSMTPKNDGTKTSDSRSRRSARRSPRSPSARGTRRRRRWPSAAGTMPAVMAMVVMTIGRARLRPASMIAASCATPRVHLPRPRNRPA